MAVVTSLFLFFAVKHERLPPGMPGLATRRGRGQARQTAAAAPGDKHASILLA